MTRFLLTILVVLALACGVAVASSWSDYSDKAAFAPALWTMIAAPLLGAYFAAQLVGLVRRPRWFDKRANAGVRCVLSGLLTGVLVVAAGALCLIYRPDVLPEWAVFACAGALATGVMVLVMPRHRAGTCVQCAYDLSAATGAVCPECGGVGTGLLER